MNKINNETSLWNSSRVKKVSAHSRIKMKGKRKFQSFWCGNTKHLKKKKESAPTNQFFVTTTLFKKLKAFQEHSKKQNNSWKKEKRKYQPAQKPSTTALKPDSVLQVSTRQKLKQTHVVTYKEVYSESKLCEIYFSIGIKVVCFCELKYQTSYLMSQMYKTWMKGRIWMFGLKSPPHALTCQ